MLYFFATDAGVIATGILERPYQALKSAGISFIVFDKVPMDSTDKDIDGMADIDRRRRNHEAKDSQ